MIELRVRSFGGESIRYCLTCGEWWPARRPFWNVIPTGTDTGRGYLRKTEVWQCRVHTGVTGRRTVEAARRLLADQPYCAEPGCPVRTPRRFCYHHAREESA